MRDLETAIQLLERDLAATLGARYVPWVRRRAQTVAVLHVVDRPQKLVDDIQDDVLELVQNVWPACPRHRNHPLWFEDGAWRCKAASSIEIPLGELSAVES